MTVTYTHSRTDNGETLAVLLDSGIKLIHDDHPSFREVLSLCMSGASSDAIAPLIDLGTQIDLRFRELTDRVTVEDGHIFYDDELIDNTLTATILRHLREDRPFGGLVRFLEKVQLNPSRRSREQLFDWIRDRDLAVTDEGNFIGYKGVQKDANGTFKSVSSGRALVNGEWHSGQIPNNIGDVVSMPRRDVQDDPGIGCSHGLHVGTVEYATGFGPHTLLVEVDPQDVVSVPSDGFYQKLRCCRYKVLHEVERPRSYVEDYDSFTNDDWDYEEWDDEEYAYGEL